MQRIVPRFRNRGCAATGNARCGGGPVAVAVLVVLAISMACGTGQPDLVVSPARAAVPVAGSSQIVLSIDNRGDGDDRLVGASTPVAAGIDIHITEIVDQRASMRTLDRVDLRAGSSVAFRPGSLHLMMVMPDDTVVDGAQFALTLAFERSEPVTVEVTVVPLDTLLDEPAAARTEGS